MNEYINLGALILSLTFPPSSKNYTILIHCHINLNMYDINPNEKIYNSTLNTICLVKTSSRVYGSIEIYLLSHMNMNDSYYFILF